MLQLLALIVVSLVVPSPTLSARLSIPFFGSFFSGPPFPRNFSPRGNPFPPFWGIMLPPPSLPGTVHGEFPSFGNYLFVPVNARVGARNDYLPKYKNGGGGGWDGVDCLPTVLERAVLCMLCMLPPMVLVRIALCWRCFTGAKNTGGARGIAVNVTAMGMAVMPVLKDFYQQGEVAASRLVAAVGATVAAATAATVAAVAVAAATAASAAIATTTATISAATAIVATTAATIVTATTAAVEATVTIFVDTATTAALLLTATAPTWAACRLLLILDIAVQRLAGTDCLAAGRAFAVVLASR